MYIFFVCMGVRQGNNPMSRHVGTWHDTGNNKKPDKGLSLISDFVTHFWIAWKWQKPGVILYFV